MICHDICNIVIPTYLPQLIQGRTSDQGYIKHKGVKIIIIVLYFQFLKTLNINRNILTYISVYEYKMRVLLSVIVFSECLLINVLIAKHEVCTRIVPIPVAGNCSAFNDDISLLRFVKCSYFNNLC